MDLIQHLALAGGLAWGSGIRLYVVLFLTGGLARLGWLQLPSSLGVLSHDWVLAASGAMVLVEFVADKVPWFDSAWDAVHTFIRIPAGALLAAGAMSSMDPAITMVAAIVGGAIASGSHLGKTGTRALVNTSPEPFSNWGASAVEDVAVPVGLIAALKFPLVFLGLLLAFLVLVIWAIPKLWRGVRRAFNLLRG